MRKFTVMTAALLLTGVVLEAHAKEPSADQWSELCGLQHEFSTKVMERRQQGVPMPEMIAVAGTDILKLIVMEAYDRPRFSTQEMRRKSVKDFANDIYLICIKQL